MGTRARIGIQNDDGSVTSIYTHWDGYPEHHGPILLEYYNHEQKIRALMTLGDLSYLAPLIGTKHDFDHAQEGECNAYGRDRGEPNVDARTHAANAWPDCGEEFHYVFVGGTWKYRQACNGRTWKTLTLRSKQ